MKNDLGDRMKMYEGMEAGRRLMPLLPALARIDGRAFHSFTRGMTRPFDAAFSVCMVDTTSALVRDTGACTTEHVPRVGELVEIEIQLTKEEWCVKSGRVKDIIWTVRREQMVSALLGA